MGSAARSQVAENGEKSITQGRRLASSWQRYDDAAGAQIRRAKAVAARADRRAGSLPVPVQRAVVPGSLGTVLSPLTPIGKRPRRSSRRPGKARPACRGGPGVCVSNRRQISDRERLPYRRQRRAPTGVEKKRRELDPATVLTVAVRFPRYARSNRARGPSKSPRTSPWAYRAGTVKESGGNRWTICAVVEIVTRNEPAPNGAVAQLPHLHVCQLCHNPRVRMAERHSHAPPKCRGQPAGCPLAGPFLRAGIQVALTTSAGAFRNTQDASTQRKA